jgi:hypothetical protein
VLSNARQVLIARDELTSATKLGFRRRSAVNADALANTCTRINVDANPLILRQNRTGTQQARHDRCDATKIGASFFFLFTFQWGYISPGPMSLYVVRPAELEHDKKCVFLKKSQRSFSRYA